MNPRFLLVSLLLFHSGACSLVFQIAWMRDFRLVFGASTAATAAVMAIFMGGLGLGNLLLGRYVDRTSRPLRFYAYLELFTALSVALSPWLIDLIRSLYVGMGGQMVLGLSGATIVRLLLTCLVLGVPTLLMGGTLPALSKAVTTADDPRRRRVAVLYGVNTLGAVVGTALATFWMLEIFGTRTTLWLACGVNLAEGSVAWLLSRYLEAEGKAKIELRPARGKAAPIAQEPRPADVQALPASFYYAAAAIVGFTFFLMELVWFRMLGPILGGTTFTFGLILVIALLGIGLGGAFYHVLFRDRAPTLRSFGLTCGLEALFIAYPFALGDHLAVLAMVLRDMELFGFYGVALGWGVVAGIVILPAAFVSGVQFPLLVALVGQGEREIGKQVGQTFAWNTVGAILGSLAGGFGALPILSATGTWLSVVILLSLLGGAVVLVSYQTEKKRAGLAFPFVLVVLSLVLMQFHGPSHFWRHGAIGAGRVRLAEFTPNELRKWRNEINRAIPWEADGVETSVALAAHDGFAFLVNGKSDGSALSDADSFIMPGLLGALLHPQPKTGLVVGLGTGETAGWLAEVPSIERVDVVELEPVINDVAQLCKDVNFNVLRHPKVRIFYNDAREVLLTSPGQYDLIVSQPSNPYRAGVAALFTREYYMAIKQRLRPGGLFLQWMQAYEIDSDTVGTVLATLRSEFDRVELWQTNPSDMLMVCSVQPVAYPVESMRQRITEEPFRTGLAVTWRAVDLEGVLARYLAGPALVDEISLQPGIRINTDDHNRLEYGSARTVGRVTGFSLAPLREAAIGRNVHRPTVQGRIDWDGVEDQRIGMGVRDRSIALHSILNADQEARGQALIRFGDGDMAGAIEAWQAQPREPLYPTELAVLAKAHAELGDDGAKPLLARLAAFNQVETAAVGALLAARQGRLEEAAGALVFVFEQLRTEPWAQFTDHIFPLAEEVARAAVVGETSNRGHVERLYNALVASPFALSRYEEQRLMTACHIAALLGPNMLADFIELAYDLEPRWIPWTEPFLRLRARAYRETNHPLAGRAERDLRKYLAHAPADAVAE